MKECWRDLQACGQFIVDWLLYTPAFFLERPVREWPGYFGSAYRVCCTLAVAREILRQ